LNSACSSPPGECCCCLDGVPSNFNCSTAAERAASCPLPALRPLLLLRSAVIWLTAAAHARSCRLLAMSELSLLAARPGQRGSGRGCRGSMRRSTLTQARSGAPGSGQARCWDWLLCAVRQISASAAEGSPETTAALSVGD
jgi:hypothetical protein